MGLRKLISSSAPTGEIHELAKQEQWDEMVKQWEQVAHQSILSHASINISEDLPPSFSYELDIEDVVIKFNHDNKIITVTVSAIYRPY